MLTYIYHLNVADYEPASAVNIIVMHFLTRMQVPLCVDVLGLFGRRACSRLSCSSRALQHSGREDEQWGKTALSQWREGSTCCTRETPTYWVFFFFKPQQQTAGFERLGFKTRLAWELWDSINQEKKKISEILIDVEEVKKKKKKTASVTRIHLGVDDVSFKELIFSPPLVSLFR